MYKNPNRSEVMPSLERRSVRAIIGTAFVLFFTCCCLAARANTLHVPSEFATIQGALDAAVSGDSVLVAEGTYTENIVWPQINDLHLRSDPANRSQPIIDGASAGRVIDLEAKGLAVFSAEISGFVITHGFLDVPAHVGQTGAGIFVSNAVLQLTECVLSDNNLTSTFAIQNNGGGAGLSIVSTPAGQVNMIVRCSFSSNTVTEVTSGDGAAIHLDSAPTLIRKTQISGNQIKVDEVALGTIYDYASDLTLEAVKIEGNTAETTGSLPVGFAAIKGTAVFSYLSSVQLVDSLIVDNSSTPQNSTLALLGAALYFYGEGTTLDIASSTIAFNTRTDNAPASGTAVFLSSLTPDIATVTNSILWNPGDGDEIDNFSKPAAVHFSDVRNGYRGRTNLNADPLFVSQDDLHLQLASPCIDAGKNRFAPPEDINGNRRPLPAGTKVDLGCYEIDQSG